MIKNIFWDFNGTILDDRDLCLELLNELLKTENKAPITYEKYLDIFGFPIKDYYKKAGIEFKYQTFEEMSEWFISVYQPLSLKLSLYDGIIQTLKTIKNMNINNICLSASNKDNLKEQIKHYKIRNFFKEILGTDNVLALGKLAVAKKYLKAQNINKENSLLIGDTDSDYELAKSLGLKCVLFTKGHQSKDRLISLGVLTIDNIKDLIKIIKGENAKWKSFFKILNPL